MNIREATIDDVPIMVNLWFELMHYHKDHHAVFVAKENTEDLIHKDLKKRVEDVNCRFFIAEIENELAGFISCSFRVTQDMMIYNKRGYVAETVVNEKFRGNGIGKKLFERAEEWFEEEGADHIELQVSLKNDGANNFWKNRGFSSTTHHMIKLLKKKK